MFIFKFIAVTMINKSINFSFVWPDFDRCDFTFKIMYLMELITISLSNTENESTYK